MPLELIHGLLKDAAVLIQRKISKADKVEALRRRQDVKNIFVSKLGLSPQWPLEVAIEVLLRDIDRTDEYPESKIKHPDKPWPFFKAELRSLYHSGIEVYNRVVGLKETENGFFVDYSGTGEAYKIARIPFDWIDHVDCAGDEYDFYPHIFCRFKNRGTPFRECRIERMIKRDGRVVRSEYLGMLDQKSGKIT